MLRKEHAGDFPAQDTTIRASCVLVASGNRSRYTFDGQTWKLDEGVLIPQKVLEVFDGREHRNLMFELGPERFTQMVTSEPGPNPHAESLRPVCWHFWPLRAGFGGFPVNDLVVTAKKAEVDGRPCAVIEQRPNASQGRWDSWEYWIDPDAGYLVRRAYRRDSRNAIREQLDLVFKWADSGERMLSEWTTQIFLGGQLEHRYHYTITNIVLNPPVTAGDFKVEPPVRRSFSKARLKHRRSFTMREFCDLWNQEPRLTPSCLRKKSSVSLPPSSDFQAKTLEKSRPSGEPR